MSPAKNSSYQRPSLPVYKIHPNVAEELLGQDNLSLSGVQKIPSGVFQVKEWWLTPLSTNVHMRLELSEPRQVDIPTVLGFLPGTDFDIADEIVVLLAPYDSLGKDFDGTNYPGANESASGVGMLLELARLWQEQSLSPRRSVLFAAWGGSHLDHLSLDDFLINETNFRHLRTISVSGRMFPHFIVVLDSVGTGEDTLSIHPDSDHSLMRLMMEEAGGQEISIEASTSVSSFKIYPKSRLYRWLALRWSGEPHVPAQDSADMIEQRKLENLGEALSLALVRLVRDNDLGYASHTTERSPRTLRYLAWNRLLGVL